METGAALGGLSLAIHCFDKVLALLRHFKIASKCCGKDAELTIDTSPVGKPKLAILNPVPPDSSEKPPSQ